MFVMEKGIGTEEYFPNHKVTTQSKTDRAHLFYAYYILCMWTCFFIYDSKSGCMHNISIVLLMRNAKNKCKYCNLVQ